jgi:predicted phage terminase large subunit-like protein
VASFKLTAKQEQANKLLAGPQMHTLLYGGSRSTKTFLLVRGVVVRALKAAMSRHCILRFRLGHIKSSIVLDTFPKVMRLAFPTVKYDLNKSDLYAQFPNESEIWFGGLDDKERVEKILGNEYVTMLFNECSQIPYASRNLALTRLAQNVTQKVDGVERQLPLRAWYDENPPTKGHWTYRLFKAKVDPETRGYLPDPDNYQCMQLNPRDNPHLPPEYIKSLEAMSARMRRRFLEGEFGDDNPNALFSEEHMDKWRTLENLPDMLRMVVAVDPSGADEEDNQDNDEIGISICGLGTDGRGYVLQDLTLKAGPATWGRVAVQAYVREKCDRIVGETNFGGAMVGFVIKAAASKEGAKVPFTCLTASRGKVVRAEPVSSLFETGEVRLAGNFPQLEDELMGFTSNAGYVGERSPNRADAMIWGISFLFPQLTAEPKKPEPVPVQLIGRPSKTAWMHR